MKSMAKFFICTVLFLLSFALFSQSNGIRKAYSFDIRKKSNYCFLSLMEFLWVQCRLSLVPLIGQQLWLCLQRLEI